MKGYCPTRCGTVTVIGSKTLELTLKLCKHWTLVNEWANGWSKLILTPISVQLNGQGLSLWKYLLTTCRRRCQDQWGMYYWVESGVSADHSLRQRQEQQRNPELETNQCTRAVGGGGGGSSRANIECSKQRAPWRDARSSCNKQLTSQPFTPFSSEGYSCSNLLPIFSVLIQSIPSDCKHSNSSWRDGHFHKLIRWLSNKKNVSMSCLYASNGISAFRGSQNEASE